MSGIAYGLAVWTGSYLGWLPVAGILPPATRDAPGRNALMIAAHIVWDGMLGTLAPVLAGDRQWTPPQGRGTIAADEDHRHIRWHSV